MTSEGTGVASYPISPLPANITPELKQNNEQHIKEVERQPGYKSVEEKARDQYVEELEAEIDLLRCEKQELGEMLTEAWKYAPQKKKSKEAMAAWNASMDRLLPDLHGYDNSPTPEPSSPVFSQATQPALCAACQGQRTSPSTMASLGITLSPDHNREMGRKFIREPEARKKTASRVKFGPTKDPPTSRITGGTTRNSGFSRGNGKKEAKHGRSESKSGAAEPKAKRGR